MGHRGLGVTPGFVDYVNKHQSDYISGRQPRRLRRNSPPPLEQPTDEDPNSMAWVEYARKVSLKIAGQIGGFEMQRFWACLPDEDNTTAREDAEVAARILHLLEEHGDFDKALSVFRSERNGQADRS
jgi:hypothetical protein